MTDDKNASAPIDWKAPEMQYLAPEDYEMPPADPVLLASANRMLSDRLERVAHVLRGCGLPALANISGAEDLQMATAALSGAYQMALADAAAVPDLRNITAELEATVALQRETLVTAAADVSRLSAELATERRVSGSAISAVARICEHLGCDDHNGHVPVLRAIDDLRAQIASLTADMVNKAFQDGINSGYAQAMEEEIARSRQVDPSTLPERDESKPAESQGLFRKFEVRRVDGSDKHGGKHHGCRYFVLDLDHDQHADAAMAAYAQACKNTHPALSAELEAQYPSEHPTKADEAGGA